MGKNKYIESPEKLLEYWFEYKNSIKTIEVPVTHPKLGTVNLSIPEPIHERGFNRWLMDNYDLGNMTIHAYFNDSEGAYKEYRTTISRIKDEIFEHNYKYSAVGMHKEKLTMALLGLAEKSESKQDINANVKAFTANFGNPIQSTSEPTKDTQ